jgi:hypothetical protein
MGVTLGVPESMAKSLRAFIEAEGLPFEVVSGGECALRVVQSKAGGRSTASELHAGGSITCTLAHELAARLGVKTREMGKLFDPLDIKIRACELGCFE